MNINEQMKVSYSHSLNKISGAIPLYLTRGSNAYGTNIPTSDIDFAGVFIQSHDDILGNKYLEQINITNDTVIYELRRFFGIMWNKNPNILELLNTP
jgi:predicted nucleotidyltransferase